MEKNIYWNIVGFIFLVGAFFTGFLSYSNLDKGLIFNDEAYYLFHFREYKNIITVDSSNFFRIFQPFYTDNIYYFRLITYILLNFSTFALFYITAKYFQLKTHPFFAGALGVAINFLTWGASNIVLQQYIGNTVLVNFSLTFLLLHLIYKQYFWLIPSGFFIGVLLFNGIPHSSVVVPIGIFLLFNFWKFRKKSIIAFVCGFVIGIVYYFLFVQNFSSFVSQLDYLKIYQQFHTKQHPKSFYFYWFTKVVGFVFIPGFIVIFIFQKFVQKKIRTLNITIAIVSITTILSILYNPSIYINYFLLFLLIYRFSLTDENATKKSFLALLLCIPFCLAFGSGAFFEVRGEQYIIYYTLAIIVILNRIFPIKFYWVYVVYFVFKIFQFQTTFQDKGWKAFVFNEQTQSVAINGHKLLLDKNRLEDLKNLQPFLQNQNKVIYSSNHLMGYLYILNAKPPIPYYFTLKNYLEFIIRKQGNTPDDYIYFESEDHSFSPKEFTPLNFVNHPENYKTIKTGRFTLYLPENYKKK